MGAGSDAVRRVAHPPPAPLAGKAAVTFDKHGPLAFRVLVASLRLNGHFLGRLSLGEIQFEHTVLDRCGGFITVNSNRQVKHAHDLI